MLMREHKLMMYAISTHTQQVRTPEIENAFHYEDMHFDLTVEKTTRSNT